jgi:hypothetical protein
VARPAEGILTSKQKSMPQDAGNKCIIGPSIQGGLGCVHTIKAKILFIVISVTH